MPLKILILLILFPIITYSQKIPVSKKFTSENPIIIDINKAYDKRKDYPLSSIAESIEYIPLETTHECLIGDNIGNITITAQDIFIFVYEDLCYHFNKQGKFINAIGSIGRGPGECSKTRNYVIDTINKWVYIVDWDKLVKYDYKGNYLASYRPGGTLGLNVLIIKPGLFLFGTTEYQHAKPNERYSFYFFSEERRKYVSRIACEKKDKIPFCICVPSLYNYNHETFISDFWSDTIYRVKDLQDLKAYAILDLGKFKHRKIEDKSILKGKTNNDDTWVFEVSKINECDRFILITSNKGLFFYDKMKKEAHCSNYIKIDDNRWTNFINDINYFAVKAFSKSPSVIHDNTLISYTDAYEFFENTKLNLPGGLENLTPEDNPVLVLIKLKK